MRRLAVLSLALVAACGGAEEDEFAAASDDALTTAKAPKIDGQIGTLDLPDRSCDVVMRAVTWSKTAGRPDTVCRGSTCRYVWTGTLDVSEAQLAQGAVPAVLFKQAANSTWYEAPTTEIVGNGHGFRRFAFRLDDGTPTKTSANKPSGTLQVTALVKRPDGRRVFDRNRAVRDNDLDTLGSATQWGLATAPSLCPGVSQPVSTLTFSTGWTHAQHGALVPGGRIKVDYDLYRLPQCMGSTYNGLSAWSTTVAMRFLPSGVTIEGPLKGWSGNMATGFFPIAYETNIPPDATSVELWFYTAGIHCSTTYDSNLGANYRFDLVPASPKAPAWAGNWGGSSDRACQHHDGLQDPITVDEYVLERACLFVDAEVYVPGLTDAGDHAERILAQVEYVLPGEKAPKYAWLQDQGRVGNNRRWRWTPDRETLRNLTGDVTYRFRFSTNGLDWYRIGQGEGPLGGAPRLIRRVR